MGKDDKVRNVIRQNILRKGFATVTDVRRFIPCSNERAWDILNTEMLQASKENKTTYKGINSKRLLKYIGLSIEEITEYADMERKGMFLIAPQDIKKES